MPQEFVLISSRYPDVTPKLRQACEAYFDSPEYRLVAGSDDLPGVILSGFARFLSRLVAEGRSDETVRMFDVVNEMDAWGDSLVSTAIRDGFLEALCDDAAHQEVYVKALSPNLAKYLIERT